MNFQPVEGHEIVIEQTQKAVYSFGAKSVAHDLGCSVEFLRKVTTPDPEPDEERHIQLRSFAKILEITGDLRPLEALAAQFGKTLCGESSGPVVSEENARELFAEAQIKIGSVLDALHASLRDGVLDRQELLILFDLACEARVSLSTFGIGVHAAAKTSVSG